LLVVGEEALQDAGRLRSGGEQAVELRPLLDDGLEPRSCRFCSVAKMSGADGVVLERHLPELAQIVASCLVCGLITLR